MEHTRLVGTMGGVAADAVRLSDGESHMLVGKGPALGFVAALTELGHGLLQ